MKTCGENILHKDLFPPLLLNLFSLVSEQFRFEYRIVMTCGVQFVIF